MRQTLFIVTALHLLLTSPVVCSPGQDNELGVCEVLKNIERFQGRIVTLKGWLNMNWRHGVNFITETETEDSTSCPGLIGKRAAWPGEIHLVWPS